LRQLVYSRLAVYEDTNDAEWLSVDPAMRHVVGDVLENAVVQSDALAGQTLSGGPSKW
jgi:hypothetical protein